MMLTPRYKHELSSTLSTYIGCLDVGDTVHDIWVVDGRFVERWTDRDVDARVIDDPLTIAALRYWALRQADAHADRIEAAVRQVRGIVRAVEGVHDADED